MSLDAIRCADQRGDTSESVRKLLYGAQSIAGFLGIERRQAFHLIEYGLPTFKVGGVVCARPEAVLAWLAEREAVGASKAAGGLDHG